MPRLVVEDKRLTGEQLNDFYEAIVDAYDDPDELERVLRLGFGKRLNLLVSLSKPLSTIVFVLLKKAEDDSWTAELLQALRAPRPNNQKLLAFAQQFELAPATLPSPELELLIKAGDQFLDVVSWRMTLVERESQVCRIERDGEARGTGFLVGPSIVLTNYHVVEDVIGGDVGPERIALRFDYKVLADGKAVSPGKEYTLAPDWDIAHSRYSDLDTQVDPGTVPGTDELDYALLRVAGTPDRDGVAGPKGTDVKAPRRGFIPVPPPSPPHAWETRKDLMILQHPDGQPLKLAMRSDGVTATLPDAKVPTRVRYTTRTSPGSSGSPCFDFSWRLVALHHGGDPKYAEFDVSPDFNEGIPLAAILRSLDQNVRDQLGKRKD
jgi:hypothetical protein